MTPADVKAFQVAAAFLKQYENAVAELGPQTRDTKEGAG